MKIGILTFPNSTSYGAVLQMYALYRIVQQTGHDVEVINYHNSYMKMKKHVEKASGESSAKTARKFLLRELLHYRLRSSFRRFEKRQISCYPLRAFEETEKLVEIGKRYDVVICGSDQVWNPDITGTDLSYFLNFCGENTKRVSYAPSFGIEEFTQEFCCVVSAELEKFSAISVREEPGKELIKKLTGREVPVVVDPTLLVRGEEWSELEQEYSVDGEYILYYTIRRSDNLLRYCKELSVKTGMKVVVVGGNILKKLRNHDKRIEYAVDISPEQWLYLVHHARYVVTNSFHGTVFSINYRKDFFVEFSSLTNSRLEQVVKTLGFEDRIVRQGVSAELSCADYTVADEKLSALCENSLNYLQNALQGESDNG